MAAVWMLAQRQWRARWPGLVVLTVVIAIAGGLVLTAFAGARRTRSAADRFPVATRAADQREGR